MFVIRLLAVASIVLVLAGTLRAPEPSPAAGEERRYVVRPGDTLWEIAVERYEGDPREAIWRIQTRNGLESAALVPGTVLALPP